MYIYLNAGKKIYILALLYIYWICMTYTSILTVKQFKQLIKYYEKKALRFNAF